MAINAATRKLLSRLCPVWVRWVRAAKGWDYMNPWAFALKAAVGRLTARQLNLPVDFYDPERHYREVRDKWFGGSSTGQAEEMDPGAARGGYK